MKRNEMAKKLKPEVRPKGQENPDFFASGTCGSFPYNPVVGSGTYGNCPVGPEILSFCAK